MENLKQIFDQCLSNSYFYESVVGIDKILEEAMQVYQGYMVDIEIDEKWPEEDNDISIGVDGYFINANIMNSKGDDHLYSVEDTKDQEIFVGGEYDESMEKVPPLDHNIGIKMTTMATHVSELYEECIDLGYGIEDVHVGVIREMARNMSAVEWFDKPTSVSIYDNKRSAYIRRIWRELNKNIKEGERLLSIGGDAGSASKRKVDYYIDCLYFDEESYQLSIDNRQKFGCKGEDFLYGTNFNFDNEDPYKWKVCTFNYYGERFILQRLQQFFSSTDCFVYGLNCSPCWNDPECVYSKEEYTDKDISKLDYDKNKMKLYSYQILGRRGNKVAVYTTHGRFEDVMIDYDEEWLYRVPLQYLHYVLPKSSDYPYLHSLMHTSLYFIETRVKGLNIGRVKFPISDRDTFEKYKKVYRIKKGSLWDNEGKALLHGYAPELDLQLLVYNGPVTTIANENEDTNDNRLLVIDINKEGNYYDRLMYLKKLGFKLYFEGEVETTYRRKWNDGLDDEGVRAANYLSLYGDKLFDELRIKALLGVFQGAKVADIFKISNNEELSKSLIALSERTKYFEIKEQSKVPYVIIYGITYNPILGDLVVGEGYKSYLVVNKELAFKKIKESFSNDPLFVVYSKIECVTHNQLYSQCETERGENDDYICELGEGSLVRDNASVYDIPLCLIPCGYAFNINDKIWRDDRSIIDIKLGVSSTYDVVDVEWNEDEHWG